MRSFLIVAAIVGAGIVSGNIAPVHAQEATANAPKVRAPVTLADGSTVSKQKRCGMEYKATKQNLNGLAWPKFWHFCSVAVKADGSQASKPIGQMVISTK